MVVLDTAVEGDWTSEHLLKQLEVELPPTEPSKIQQPFFLIAQNFYS